MKLKIENVRLSFPSLFRRAVFNGEEGKFGATFLLSKTDHAEVIKKIRSGIAEVVKDRLKGSKLGPDKVCLRNGDDSQYDGYAGCESLKASNSTRPIVLNRDRSPLTADDGVVYAGCYVNAIIELWGQDNQFGKRVNANLLGVQFVRDGEPFGDGGRAASQDDFDVVKDDGPEPWESP